MHFLWKRGDNSCTSYEYLLFFVAFLSCHMYSVLVMSHILMDDEEEMFPASIDMHGLIV